MLWPPGMYQQWGLLAFHTQIISSKDTTGAGPSDLLTTEIVSGKET